MELVRAGDGEDEVLGSGPQTGPQAVGHVGMGLKAAGGDARADGGQDVLRAAAIALRHGQDTLSGRPGGGAPPRNKNAQKHGGYAAVFFDQLTDDEKFIMDKTPKTAVKALREELGILKVQEKRILSQITALENADQDELYISTLLDMRVPGKVNGAKQDGANQNMGMYSKESAFTRKMHLQEALNKVEGRIATIIGKLQQAEETEARMKLERERIEFAKARAIGAFDVPDETEEDADNDPLHK